MRVCEMISVHAGSGPGPDDGFVPVEVPCIREARWFVLHKVPACDVCAATSRDEDLHVEALTDLEPGVTV